MKLSEIIRYYGWKTPRILYGQHRWNKLAAKGFTPREICLVLGLNLLDDAA
jgi:hypothetical protein